MSGYLIQMSGIKHVVCNKYPKRRIKMRYDNANRMLNQSIDRFSYHAPVTKK